MAHKPSIIIPREDVAEQLRRGEMDLAALRALLEALEDQVLVLSLSLETDLEEIGIREVRTKLEAAKKEIDKRKRQRAFNKAHKELLLQIARIRKAIFNQQKYLTLLGETLETPSDSRPGGAGQVRQDNSR